MKQHSEILTLLHLRDDTYENEEDFSGNSNTKEQNLTTRIVSTFYFIFYAMTKHAKASLWWGFFVVFYNALQLFALTFVAYDTNTPVSSFSWIKTQIDYITLRNILNSSFIAIETSFIIVLVALFTTLLISLWVGQQFWTTGHVRSGALLQVLYYLSEFQRTILYMPFITILVASMKCGTGLAECDGSADSIALTTFIAILLCCFVLFYSVMTLLVIENSPKVYNAFASPHGRVEALSTFLRGLLNIIISLFGTSSIMAQTLFIIFFGGLVTAIFVKFMPFYDPLFNRLTSAAYSITAWAGVCLLVSDMLMDYDRNIYMTCLLMGAPLVSVATWLLVVVREAFVGNEEVTRSMSPYYAELVLRCKWKTEAHGKKVAAYRAIVDDLFPENAYMLMNVSIMYSLSGSASLLAGQYASKANRHRSKSFDERFYIYRIFKRQHDEKNSESGSINYLTLKHHQTSAEFNIVESLRNIETMFESLRMHTLTATELFRVAQKIDRTSSRAKENLDMLVKLTKSAPRVLLLYAIYASEVMFDYALSKKLYRSALVSFRQNNESGKGSDMDTVTIVISGNEANIGVIIDCSDNIESVYGYHPADIIGKNVDYLCPPPINNGVHERFLRHYIETAENFIPVSRTIWVRHTDGYYARCSLHVSPTQDAETGNLVFQGKLSRIQTDVEFLGIKPNGEILFYSEGVLKAFGLRAFFDKDSSSGDQHVAIQKVIPAMSEIDFESTFEKLKAEPGYTETLTIETGPGESYLTTVIPKYFPQAGVKFVVIDMKLQAEKHYEMELSSEESESDSEAENEFDDAPPVMMKAVHNESNKSLMTPFLEQKKKQGTEDESGSIVSDSTSTSLRQASKIRAAIRMRIENEKTRLRRFQSFALLFACVLVLLAIISLVVNNLAYRQLSDDITTFHLSGERAYLLLSSGIAMLQMLDPNATASYYPAIVEKLSANVIDIETKHQEVLHHSASQTSRVENLHYNSALVEEFQSDWSVKTISFNSAVLKIVSYIRAFLNTNSQTCTTPCQYVINNANWDLIDLTLDMITVYKYDAESKFEDIEYFNVGLVSFVGLIVLAALVGFITPRLLEVKHVKDDISLSIGQIQGQGLKRVCTYNSQRTQRVSLMINHINKSQDPFKVNWNEIGRDIRIPNLNRGLRIAKGKGAEKKRSWWAVLCCKKRGTDTKNKIHPSANTESEGTDDSRKLMEQGLYKSLIISFLSMSLPLIMIILYFGLVLYGNLMVEHKAEAYLNSLNANVIRWVNFERVGFSSYVPDVALTPSWSRWFANSTKYNESLKILDTLESIELAENIVLYGNNEGIGAPFIDKTNTPDLYKLHYIDACFTMDSCTNASKSYPGDPIVDDLGDGMEVTMANFIERGQQFIKGLLDRIITFEALIPFAEANSASVDLFSEYLFAYISSFQKEMLLFALLAICLFVFAVVFLVKVFRGLNKELLDAHSLLLLLPADVLDSIPSLQELVADR